MYQAKVKCISGKHIVGSLIDGLEVSSEVFMDGVGEKTSDEDASSWHSAVVVQLGPLQIIVLGHLLQHLDSSSKSSTGTNAASNGVAPRSSTKLSSLSVNW